MINPNWSVVDLDPRTWRNLGRFFHPGQYIRAVQPDTHCLFVLHENGKLKKVVDNEREGSPDLAIERVDDPVALAKSLYERGEWQQVHVINKRHLAEVARMAQAYPRRSLSLDQYYRQVFHLLWDNSNGYVSIPPHPGHWQGWTYKQLEDFVGQLPAESTLALGVFEDDTLEIGLILEFQDGEIKLVTTFEAMTLAPGAMQLSEQFLEQLWLQLGQQFAPPAGLLLCNRAVFEEWLEAEDKFAVLSKALPRKTALWKLDLDRRL